MKRRNFIRSLAIGSGAAVSAGSPVFAYTAPGKGKKYDADIIIYGGTSAAVTAAVQAKKLGKSVIIVSPDKHPGGMTSGGLGFTDTGNKTVIGGLAREFYHRIYLHYNRPESWKWQKKEAYGNKGQGTPAVDGENRTMWIFEPHAAEKVFEDLVKENGIPILRNEWLDREKGAEINNGRIISFKTVSGNIFSGKMFIDATYEGDLMAAAHVGYTVGREPAGLYNEKWGGIVTEVFHHGHYFKSNIDPYKTPGDPLSGLLPRISPDPPGNRGNGDKKVQAYCYRMCLSNHPENQVPFPRPKDYDPYQYELIVRIFNAGWRELFQKFDPIPNMKTDTNNHGPFSTDNIGMNYAYPDASYKLRRRIIEEHKIYQKGLMYFIATDPRIPREVQDEFNSWGLAKDEFADNDNWPQQLYVREARRMVGELVMTENEILGKNPVTDPIGMGSYTLDSHNIQRYVTPQGYVQNEGDFGVHVPRPYSISYRSILPKEKDCKNLLVPVCLSSSHVAYGSIRMEPVFMILGESAATAAVNAIDNRVSVQKVNYGELKKQLLEQGQRLD
ncbi:FAD-dependent oxidoreductase [Agriterribacter sp.]|uniref:FAD-dependent oxidoreductase n=1 Tax=Agriterribacter sp. TaxID=2821509 RepID=UPI002BEE76EC|nr:FAD-dependent oxidoreductase [Agriterribacter sp.]HRP55486.1 FAD-dependent oxidoreductase [Agriterribacter sp.]